jgi:hypothetical protein
MDESDMEEEGKDREGEEWGIGIQKVILQLGIRKPVEQNKA